jgi:flavin reductase (DIM6/NTAB) family NADH-FMN oxidoreductase RutF
MTTTDEIFAQLNGKLDYPMLVVTTRAGNERAGCLVGFASQCSIDPARFLVCLSDKNRTFRLAQRAEALAVHYPPAASLELAQLFGSETGDDTDKFTRCQWHDGPQGLPILDECGRWFTGRILERHGWGDHVGFLLEPFAAADDGSSDTLSFARAKRLEPGHDA